MIIRRASRWLAFPLLVLVALSLASCGPREITYPESGATLEGTVKLGKDPVPYALVIAVGQQSSQANVDRDGRYKITNCPVGEVKIAVNTEAGRGDYMTLMMSATQPGGPGEKSGKKVELPKFVDVPKKYHDPETSGLKCTVNKGANTFDILLSRDGK